MPEAEGDVLEIGIGSGRNLRLYDGSRVRSVTGIDPSGASWSLRRETALPFRLTFLEVGAESIPLEPASIDTVVSTYTLCSVAEPERALAECRRLLRPGGRLLFSEHGASPDERVRRRQRRWKRLWRRVAGGCRLDLAVPFVLERSGFRIERIESGYLPGWKPASYHYWGSAAPDDRAE